MTNITPLASKTKPQLITDDDQSTILQIQKLINRGTFPNLYSYEGIPALIKGTNQPKLEPLTSNQLLKLIAQYTISGRSQGNRSPKPELPSKHLVDIALSSIHEDEWSGLPKIRGIVRTPVLTPDRKFLTKAGYDQDTELFHIPAFEYLDVPKAPTPHQVSDSKEFLTEYLLGDFPFQTPHDRTNSLALLVTQLLKPAYQFLVPMAFITAPRAASGKTHLANMHEEIFGGNRISWAAEGEKELGKRIDAALTSSLLPTIIFDNLPTGFRLQSAVLAEILTSRVHTARILGTSNTVETPNNRLWFVTGNNLKLGGDIPSRVIPININPEDSNPEDRRGFKVNLNRWTDELRQKVLYCIMVLVQDWLSNDAPEDETVTLRGFEHWFQVLSGFCNHHNLPPLLGNRKQAVASIDEEDSWWTDFFQTIFELMNDHYWKPSNLLEVANGIEKSPSGKRFPLYGPALECFPKNDDDSPYSAIRLGKLLQSHVGMFHGEYKLIREKDLKSKGYKYRMQKAS